MVDKRVIDGNQAVSLGVKLSGVEVIAAYPITPQTSIVEELSNYCDDGSMDAVFIHSESEHSAIATCIGAANAGSRVFTATSSQGLALMHELLHWAAGSRLPIVLANINRAMAPPWTIFTDQSDSLSQRDTGWLQLYCCSNQEVLDTVIMSFNIAEQVLLPVMLVLDAFVLSHTSEIVEVPNAEDVARYLPPREPIYRLDPEEPHTIGGLMPPDSFMETRYNMHKAMEEAVAVLAAEGKKFERMTGRGYGTVEPYLCDDAEFVLLTSGTIGSTARIAVDKLREEGVPAGMLRVRLFRPFPARDIAAALPAAKRIGVIDRNISYGHGGIFAQELKSSFYTDSVRSGGPEVTGFVAGLGGRDVTPDHVEGILRRLIEPERAPSGIEWVNVRES